MTEAVEIESFDGLVLRGEVRRAGPDWALLVHDQGEDIDAWRPLSGPLASAGLTVLAVDLRGHGGSDGEPAPATSAGDLGSMVVWAREQGAERVYVLAAGESARPALEVAGSEGCAAAVLVAPVGDGIVRVTVPRLSVVSSGDPRQQTFARALHRAPGWSLVANIPVAASGCRILASSWGSNAVDHVLAFLRDRRGPKPVAR